jgi:peptide/nickel transport system substrate-binding protein
MPGLKPIVATVSAALMVLVACSSGGVGGEASPPSATVTSGVAAGKAIDPTREAPAAPVPGAVRGGTVTVLVNPNSSYETLDPTASYDIPVYLLSGLVTRSLTQYVYDPAQHTMVLVPDIATDTGTSNADFTRWTFTIRDGVRFEDGTPVTAQDVAFGIERSFDSRTFPDVASYSIDYFLDGQTYKGPYRSGTSFPGIVVHGNTLTLKMARPFPDMPYWAAWPSIGPIPAADSNPATYGLHPLATGPYKVAHFSPGKSLTLVRNDEWDSTTDPGRHAYPDRYVFHYPESPEQVDAAILGDSKRGQTTLSDGNVLAADYRTAKRLHRVTVGSKPCTHWLLPDNRKITDIRIRRAIAFAYPYKAIARVTGQVTGVTSLAGTSILPPEMPGRQNYNALGMTPGRTDTDKARKLLKRAGYALGQYRLSWAYDTSDPNLVERTNQLAKGFELAGFKAVPHGLPSPDEAAAVDNDPNGPVNIRELGSGWCADWPVADSFIPPLFETGASENLAFFSEPDVDRDIGRIGRLPIDEQPPAWGALDKTIMTRYFPAIVTDYGGVAMLHGSRIGGMNDDDSAGNSLTWKDLYVIR